MVKAGLMIPILQTRKPGSAGGTDWVGARGGQVVDPGSRSQPLVPTPALPSLFGAELSVAASAMFLLLLRLVSFFSLLNMFILIFLQEKKKWGLSNEYIFIIKTFGKRSKAQRRK